MRWGRMGFAHAAQGVNTPWQDTIQDRPPIDSRNMVDDIGLADWLPPPRLLSGALPTSSEMFPGNKDLVWEPEPSGQS